MQIERNEVLNDENDMERNCKLLLLEENLSACVLTRQRESLLKELKYLKDTKAQKGKIATLFCIKERIVGPKKSSPSAVSLVDPVTHTEVNTVQGIKNTTLAYCSSLLTNGLPVKGFEADIEFKVLLNNLRIKPDNYDTDQDLFDSTFDELVKKPGAKYDFINKAGPP